MIFTAICNKRAKNPINSVESMTLTVSGMRGTSVYRFEVCGGVEEIRNYRKIYSGAESELVLNGSVPCDVNTISALMNSCGVRDWNGFCGKHPKNVLDGVMFCFEASVNGGQAVRAHGSENFPKGFHEFVSVLDRMLAPTDSPPSRRCSPAGAPAKNDSYVTDISRNLPARNHSDFPALGLETTPLPNTPISTNAVWKCHTCGTVNSGMFCAECGMPCRQTSH